MLMDKYFETLEGLFKTIRETQREAMEKAADAIVNSISNGGEVHIFDSGHIINSELIHRAGGFIFMKPFNYSLNVNSNPRIRNTEPKIKANDADVIRLAFSRSNVRPGDIFILGSVSGKSANIIDLAFGAKEAGCTLITMTSGAYSQGLQSQHSSGKRLFEMGDFLLDNCAPEGDAMMSVEGIEHKVFPA
ncbi:MAG: sugar isomerase protein, partial [Clostridia bacterium]|nr:sugar isomerase protein [Clostridia bacterium]